MIFHSIRRAEYLFTKNICHQLIKKIRAQQNICKFYRLSFSRLCVISDFLISFLIASCLLVNCYWVHIIISASEAERRMNLSKKSQSIVLLGESGSGKIENTNHLMNYLCVSSNSNNAGNAINTANPILEAFGNAQTSANNNSSRFSKCTKVCERIFTFSTCSFTIHLQQWQKMFYAWRIR